MGAPHAFDFALIVVSAGDPALVAGTIGPVVDADSGARVVLVDNFHSPSRGRPPRRSAASGDGSSSPGE